MKLIEVQARNWLSHTVLSVTKNTVWHNQIQKALELVSCWKRVCASAHALEGLGW
jgi:hypothetical protein